MFSNTTIPAEIQTNLGKEKPDFVIKAGRAEFLHVSIFKIIVGLGLLAIIIIASLFILIPLLTGNALNITLNGEATIVSLSNLGPLIEPAIFIAIMTFIALTGIIQGIISIKKEGGCFMATPTRLIAFDGKQTKEFTWDNFAGLKTFGTDKELGTLILKLKPDVIKKPMRKSKRKNYNLVTMIQIPHAMEIESICKERIKSSI